MRMAMGSAYNRRIVYFNERKGGIGMSPRGKAVLHGRTDVPDFSHVEGGADPFANYLFTYDMEGKLTGAIINVGYTAQVSIKDRYVSSDTWHDMRIHALEKEMATHSSVLAWRIPETGEPGGLLSMGSHRVGHD